ncbi:MULTISPECIES: hypothetical protein [Paenibacillus]|nr:hypothetical protein [Paenibacillus lautus]
MATLVDEKIKKMPPQTLESIFLKGDTYQGRTGIYIKIMAVMTGSAI